MFSCSVLTFTRPSSCPQGVTVRWVCLLLTGNARHPLCRACATPFFLRLSPRALRPLACSAGGGGGGQAAKDANGDTIKSKKWLATHLPGDRQLSQGLKVRPAGRSGGVGALPANLAPTTRPGHVPGSGLAWVPVDTSDAPSAACVLDSRAERPARRATPRTSL